MSLGLGEPSIATSDWIAPTSTIADWLAALCLHICVIADAASEHWSDAAALFRLFAAVLSTWQCGGMPPALAIAVWLCSDLFAS